MVEYDILIAVDFPALYHAANAASRDGQERFLQMTRARLVVLIAAASLGLFSWRIEGSPIDWAGVACTGCFFVALAIQSYLLKSRPERTWYEGRAAAESVKTLSWRYAVGAEPFNIGREPEPVVANLFLAQLTSALETLKHLDLSPVDSSGYQITKEMSDARATSLANRKALYERDRVQNQQAWYLTKARWNRQRARAWTVAMLGVEIVGMLLGILKAVGVLAIDLLGFAGAIAAAMTAWLQTKQHDVLATAYTVTAIELATVRSKITLQSNEADWSRFVSDAEEAFSREHTLWKASRGPQSI